MSTLSTSLFPPGYRPTKRIIVVMTLGLLAPMVSTAEVYKWVDENGVVHYGDRRPDQPAETVDIDVAPAEEPAPAIESTDEVNEALRIVTESKERREKSERERDEATAARQKYAAQCQQLVDKRNKLQAGGFLYRRGDENRNALSDEEISAEIASLNRQLQEHCPAH